MADVIRSNGYRLKPEKRPRQQGHDISWRIDTLLLAITSVWLHVK